MRKRRKDAGVAKWWTRERVIAAIQEWAREHGEPPRSLEWRRATPAFPHDATVKRLFGSWNAAIAAAGFEPREQWGFAAGQERAA